MKTALLLTIALSVSPTLAGGTSTADCPTPPKLTCERLLEKAEERCTEERLDKFCAPVPPQPRTIYVNVPTPGPERVVERTTFVDVPVYEEPRDTFIVGAGADYMHGLGATVMGGYIHRSGFGVQAQGSYTPQRPVGPIAGTVEYRCREIPYLVPQIEEKHPFGAAVLATYSWKIGGKR